MSPFTKRHEPDSISRRTPIALCMETCWVSAYPALAIPLVSAGHRQKSADGIVVPRILAGDEGQNAEMRGASDKLDIGDESERMSLMSARYGNASPRFHPGGRSCKRCGCGFNVRLRPDDFREPPIADPHDGWCGEGRLITVPYPISRPLIPFEAAMSLRVKRYVHLYVFSQLRLIICWCFDLK